MSRDQHRPIKGQYLCHGTSINQSEGVSCDPDQRPLVSVHLEVDISGGSLQDGLVSQGQSVAGVDAVIVTPTV